MKEDKQIVAICQTTVSRRSVLEWIGKATVLALGAEFIAACSDMDAASQLDEPPKNGPDGGASSTAPFDFQFYPGDQDGELFESWGERTVDGQNIIDIIENWTLVVDGLVEHPLELSFADLVSMNRRDQTSDFHCVEGWSVYDVPWNGVHLSALFQMAKPLPSASHVTFHTQRDVYNESLPLSVALESETLLAYGINGFTLPLSKGFPMRLVVPDKLAYKSAKYVYRIELDDMPRMGFWEQRGYPYEAEVPAGRLRNG